MALGDVFSLGAGAVSDLYGAKASRLRAQGDRIEADQYTSAAGMSRRNEDYTRMSTEIQKAQLDRTATMTIGGMKADVASSGFTQGGSALDIMRDATQQAALTKAVATQQGLITEEGYEQQAKSYDFMAQHANITAQADDTVAQGLDITSDIKFAGAAVSAIPILGKLF